MKSMINDELAEIEKTQPKPGFMRVKLFNKGDILNKDFYVKYPIYGILTMDSDGLYMDCEYLEIYSTGQTMNELMKDIIDELYSSYKIYVVNNPEDTLNPRAIQLKKKLKKCIGRKNN